MNNKNKFEVFQYFLELYFFQSYDWSELDKTTFDFRYSESYKKVALLEKELNSLQKLNDWDFVKEFVRKHAGRKYDKEKVKLMIDIILECLTDPNWDKESYKPFF